MKIDSVTVTSKEIYGVYKKTQETANVSKSSAPTESDRVELSEEAVTFSAAMKAAKDSMETADTARQEKIESIKKRIDNGTYSVSGEDVAKKMLGIE